jgi:hypothetical protein
MAQLNGHLNPSWKGGRTITEHGYVLIKVGRDHHLADVRGYAYEHRVVAETAIGRRLRPGEHVHHIDHNTLNNSPDNLHVAESAWHHRVIHRRVGHDRRKPGEPNPLVKCACGCGEAFQGFDESGRPRRYISGHNPQEAPRTFELLRLLVSGPQQRKYVVASSSGTKQAVGAALSKLKEKGFVSNKHRGWWELTILGKKVIDAKNFNRMG